MFAKEKIENLKNLLCKERTSYSYSSKPKDETIKMPLTAEEYNSKLKDVETELRTFEKEFGLEEEKLGYIEIKEKIEDNFENWVKENEDELRENFEQNEDDTQTFDEYCDFCYSQRDDNEE